MSFCYDSVYDSLLLVYFQILPGSYLLWRTGKDIMLQRLGQMDGVLERKIWIWACKGIFDLMRGIGRWCLWHHD